MFGKAKKTSHFVKNKLNNPLVAANNQRTDKSNWTITATDMVNQYNFEVWKDEQGGSIDTKHQAVGMRYTTIEGKDPNFLKAEIFVDHNTNPNSQGRYEFETVLKLVGPAKKDLSTYKRARGSFACFSAPIEFTAQMRQVESIIDGVYRDFGPYHIFTNNCQDFATKLLEELEKLDGSPSLQSLRSVYDCFYLEACDNANPAIEEDASQARQDDQPANVEKDDGKKTGKGKDKSESRYRGRRCSRSRRTRSRHRGRHKDKDRDRDKETGRSKDRERSKDKERKRDRRASGRGDGRDRDHRDRDRDRDRRDRSRDRER